MDWTRHSLYGWLTDFRRDIHAHPELSWRETRTTDRIKAVLMDLGLKPVDLPGLDVGAAAVLEGAADGPTLALRADIDALPLTERADVPYKSTVDGVMHACGHDCHTAVVLGAAKKAVDDGLAGSMAGRIKFIFQPAEETVAGARSMIDAGVLENPNVDRIFMVHMDPDMPVGQVALFKGASHANTDIFDVVFEGRGGHGSRPHQTQDPVLAGSHFVQAVQSIVSRNVDAQKAAVVSVCRFDAGTASNIIPAQARLSGTVRTLDDDVQELVRSRLDRAAAQTAELFDLKVDFQYKVGAPACINNPEAAEHLHRAAAPILGEQNILYPPARMGGEDFALFARRVPGAVMRVGCSTPGREGTVATHSPYFVVDEASLPLAVDVLIAAARDFLKA